MTLALNITAAQAQGSFQAASVLEPLATFLGDHVTSVQLAGSSAASATQVRPGRDLDKVDLESTSVSGFILLTTQHQLALAALHEYQLQGSAAGSSYAQCVLQLCRSIVAAQSPDPVRGPALILQPCYRQWRLSDAIVMQHCGCPNPSPSEGLL